MNNFEKQFSLLKSLDVVDEIFLGFSQYPEIARGWSLRTKIEGILKEDFGMTDEEIKAICPDETATKIASIIRDELYTKTKEFVTMLMNGSLEKPKQAKQVNQVNQETKVKTSKKVKSRAKTEDSEMSYVDLGNKIKDFLKTSGATTKEDVLLVFKVDQKKLNNVIYRHNKRSSEKIVYNKQSQTYY